MFFMGSGIWDAERLGSGGGVRGVDDLLHRVWFAVLMLVVVAIGSCASGKAGVEEQDALAVALAVAHCCVLALELRISLWFWRDERLQATRMSCTMTAAMAGLYLGSIWAPAAREVLWWCTVPLRWAAVAWTPILRPRLRAALADLSLGPWRTRYTERLLLSARALAAALDGCRAAEAAVACLRRGSREPAVPDDSAPPAPSGPARRARRPRPRPRATRSRTTKKAAARRPARSSARRARPGPS